MKLQLELFLQLYHRLTPRLLLFLLLAHSSVISCFRSITVYHVFCVANLSAILCLWSKYFFRCFFVFVLSSFIVFHYIFFCVDFLCMPKGFVPATIDLLTTAQEKYTYICMYVWSYNNGISFMSLLTNSTLVVNSAVSLFL